MEKVRQKLKEGIERGKIKPVDAQKASERIIPFLDFEEGLKKVDLVIEAVYEDMNLKKEIFKKLSLITSNETILASNTSTLSISEIATMVDNPQRVIGIHFFSPPEAMKLTEIIIGSQTSDEVKNTSMEFASSIGKIPISAKDSPGFIVNRILLPLLNEAIKLLDEGVATVEEIDQAIVLGANFPVGPFVLTDMVGLDVALASLKTFEEKLGEFYKPSKTLVKLVEEGKLGMKTGEGFHKYA